MINSKDILNEIKKVSVCCVSTLRGTEIKNRMMHFAVDSELKFYLSSISTDPKVKQIVLNPQVTLLIYIPGSSFSEDKEVEVTGYAKIVSEKEREKAIELLTERSPVVSQLSQYNKLDVLSFIEVIPRQIKFRCVKEILQGISPTVINFEERKPAQSMWLNFKRKLDAWIAETRYPFLSVSILPVILGTIMAWNSHRIFNSGYFILTLLGVIFLHLGTNIINDFFDHISGNDELNTEFVRPFSGGSRMIQLGLLTPMEVLFGALTFFSLGSLIGLYLVHTRGLPVLILGIIGIISGAFYTSPILNWASKGVGELLVGLNFGVLITIGSYYVQTKTFSFETLFASLPLGLLIAAILFINEFPDYSADKKTGKKTLVVRLGRERSVKIFIYLIILTYILIASGILGGFLPEFFLLSFISLPIVINSFKILKRFHSSPFDMAAANGMTILTFNIIASVSIISYLISSAKEFYIFPVFLITLAYILWNYRTIMNQKEAFHRLKQIV